MSLTKNCKVIFPSDSVVWLENLSTVLENPPQNSHLIECVLQEIIDRTTGINQDAFDNTLINGHGYD